MSSIARVRRRAAAACLPAAIASMMLGMVPGQGSAAPMPSLYTQIEHASHNSLITLKMSDGISVAGVFNGFIGDWRDSVASAARYEQWRATRPAGVPRLDEPMSILLASGDTLSGTFRGAGPGFVALRTEDQYLLVPVNYDVIDGAVRDSSTRQTGADLRGALLEAPHLKGVSLRQGGKTWVVPRESIRGVEGSPSQGESSNTGFIALVVVGALVATVLICASEANSASNDLTSSCSKAGSSANINNRFVSGDLTHGPGPWPRGETLRP